MEFIQRVCSECTSKDDDDDESCPPSNNKKKVIQPGCGGFGIRNFLTLFLSIEVSKAMSAVSRIRDALEKEPSSKKDIGLLQRRLWYAQEMVDCFTAQLDESNPILTAISNAMTEEGVCRQALASSNNNDSSTIWQERLQRASDSKAEGNRRLMECSVKYQKRMQCLREEEIRELGSSQ